MPGRGLKRTVEGENETTHGRSNRLIVVTGDASAVMEPGTGKFGEAYMDSPRAPSRFLSSEDDLPETGTHTHTHARTRATCLMTCMRAAILIEDLGDGVERYTHTRCPNTRGSGVRKPSCKLAASVSASRCTRLHSGLGRLRDGPSFCVVRGQSAAHSSRPRRCRLETVPGRGGPAHSMTAS